MDAQVSLWLEADTELNSFERTLIDMKHWKIIGLALVALTAFMAINAAGAQAKWLLLRNKVSVETIKVTGTTEAGRLLVPGLVTIECTGGAGSAEATDAGHPTELSGTATVTFSGCTVAEFGEVCSVRGSGDAVGSKKITASGSGVASMTGSEVFLNASSTKAAPFATVVFEGAECPFIELDGRTFGSVTFKVGSPLEDNATHSVEITSQSLTFGANPAKIENNAGGNLKGSVKDVGNETIAVHLKELTGCPTIC